jgi:Domain of unknown function (DUF222)
MFERLVQVRGQLTELVAAVDPDAISGQTARGWWVEFDRVERLAAAGKTLLARRLADTHRPEQCGTKTAAEELAREAGTTTGAAKDAVSTSERLVDQPGVESALRRGELSAAQAAAISAAAAANPAEEQRLVDLAPQMSLVELREECARVRAAADPDPEATHRRIHAARALRHWVDGEGFWNLHAKGTPAAGAVFTTALQPIIDQVFKDAHRAGRRESHEAYAFDALIHLAQHATGACTCTTVPNGRGGADATTPTGAPKNSGVDAAGAWSGDDGATKPSARAAHSGVDAAGAWSGDDGATKPSARAARSGVDAAGAWSGDDGATKPSARGAQNGTDEADARNDDDAAAQELASAQEATFAKIGADEVLVPEPAGEPWPTGGAENSSDQHRVSSTAGRSASAASGAAIMPGDPGIFAAGRGGAGSSCAVPVKATTNPRYLALLRVDVEALRRGNAQSGELCEIAGVGPVPVSVAREVLGEAIVKLVLTNGVDVLNVTHLGRGPTAAQRAALLWINPTCSVQGCPRSRIEIDHQKPWAQTHHTRLDELDGLCQFHHDLKTRLGYALVPGRGKRAFVAPDDPKHPTHRTPPGERHSKAGPVGAERAGGGAAGRSRPVGRTHGSGRRDAGWRVRQPDLFAEPQPP